MYNCRHFNPTDAEYRVVADLVNAANPNGRQAIADEMKVDDLDWEEGYLNQRYVVEKRAVEKQVVEQKGAEVGRGCIVAVGSAYEAYWAYKAGEVHFLFNVHPDYVNQGFEGLLYAYLVEQLQNRTPKLERLIIRYMADELDRIAFIESKEFTVRERESRSALTLQTVDLSPLAGREEAALADGIRLYTLAEIQALVPDWKVQLLALRNALDQDVPGAGPKMKRTLAQFERMVLQDPALDPEAWWIAVDENHVPGNRFEEARGDGTSISNSSIRQSEDRKHDYRDHLDLGAAPVGEFIGYSNLWINDETRKRLDTGMTGVLRSHRRRGIATLLKYKAIAYGQRHNAEQIVATNEENNPMLELNYRLGFKPIPGWIHYEKIFQTEQEQSEEQTTQSQRTAAQATQA